MTVQVYRSKDGRRIAVIAPTWDLNPKITKESLADEFARNERRAWRDYGAEPSYAVEALFRDPEVVLNMANRDREDPWDPEPETWKPWFRGGPHEYYCHFDLSETRAATGFALGHYDCTSERVVIDAMLVFRPGAGRPVDYSGLRRLVYDLTNRGFHIACVSYDRFQSAESRQVLASRGYRVATISTDTSYHVELTRPVIDRNTGRQVTHVTPKPLEIYDTLQECLISGRLDYFPHPTLISELRTLELQGGSKVVPGPNSSKDLADAVAIVTWQCIVNREGLPSGGSGRGFAPSQDQLRALTRAMKFRSRT